MTLDLTGTATVTTITLQASEFSFQYGPFCMLLVLFLMIWSVPGSMCLFDRQKNPDSKREQVIISDYVPFLFKDSLTFLPFLVFLPLIVWQKAIVRLPVGPLLAWAIIAHVLWRIQLYNRAWAQLSVAPLWRHVRMFLAWFKTTHPRRIWWLVFGFFTVSYSLVAIQYTQSLLGLSGDEPEYVMVAHSLLNDHDLMVRDNYERLEYRLFLRYSLPFGRTTWEGYPVEGILLSLYLLPFYWLVLHFPAHYLLILRLAVVPLAALLMAELFLLLENLTGRREQTAGLVVLAGLTAPLLFYAPLIFSEILGALLVVGAIRSLDLMMHGHSSGYGPMVRIGLLVWTGAKYVVLALPLLLWFIGLIVYQWYRGHNQHRKHLLVSFALLLIMLGLYLTFLWTFYHSLSPLATRGGELLDFTRKQDAGLGDSLDWLIADRLSRLPLSGRVACGYFLDQRVGILIYSPFYILLFSGIFWIIRRREWRYGPVLVMFGLYWFMLFWLCYWEGYGPPSRYTIPVIPLMLIFIIRALKANKAAQLMLLPLASMSLFVSLTALQNPALLYHHTLWRYADQVNNFLEYYSGSMVPLAAFLPSFTASSFAWGPFIVLVLLVILFIILSLQQRFPGFTTCILVHNLVWMIVPCMILSLTFLDPAPVLPDKCETEVMATSSRISLSKWGYYGWEHDGFWTRTGQWAGLGIDLDGPGSEQLGLLLSSLVENELLIRSGLRHIKCFIPPTEAKLIEIRDLPVKKQGDRNLFYLEFKSIEGRNPYYDDRGDDGRELGAFVRIIPNRSANEASYSASGRSPGLLW